ncbi:hypothetical protein HDU93_000876 [Gonapodya sp. JEL0774]|nr:hypothetical protein HDU93_000876 [Gonapodya sp. JEL0774]
MAAAVLPQPHNRLANLNFWEGKDGVVPAPLFVGQEIVTIDRPLLSKQVEVQDISGREDKFNLDNASFQYRKHTTNCWHTFGNNAMIEKEYYRECEQVLVEATGGCRAHVFDHRIRRSTVAGGSGKSGPVLRVHVDESEKGAIAYLRHYLPNEAEELLKKRWQIVNVWRPLKTIQRDPLTVADGTTFEKGDFVPAVVHYDGGAHAGGWDGESLTVIHKDAHRWYYKYLMTPDEVVLIKNYDSALGVPARRCPHSAIEDGTEADGMPPRESIEPPVYPPEKYNNLNATSGVGYVCCSQVPNPICTGGIKEDCLVLHVYTPVNATTSSTKLPGDSKVMVWIHGGALVTGNAARFNGSYITNTQKVVLVKLNYRLGAFGFMGSSDLLEEADGKGLNYGLQDQIAALKWVQANVAAFGGDPSDVTVFGQSAGAISIGWLSLIPQAAGLFNKVIMESGGPGSIDGQAPDSLYSVNGQYQRALKAFNITDPKLTPAQRVAALRNVSEGDLVKWAFSPLGINPGMPTIDGVTIKTNSWELLRNGKIHSNIEAVIIGDNENEGTIFTSVYGNNYSVMATFLNGTSSPHVLPPDPTLDEELYPSKFVDRMLALYFDGRKGDKFKEFDGAGEIIGDFLFYSNNRIFAEAAAAAGKNVYKYRFTVSATGSNVTDSSGFYTGVTHGGELLFVFLEPSLAPSDQLTSLRMATSWASLAKHGDPNVELVNATGVTEWPKYNPRERVVRVFGANGTCTAVPEESLKTYSGYRKAGNELIQACAPRTDGAAATMDGVVTAPTIAAKDAMWKDR